MPWTEEPDELQSMGPQRVRCDWAHAVEADLIQDQSFWYESFTGSDVYFHQGTSKCINKCILDVNSYWPTDTTGVTNVDKIILSFFLYQLEDFYKETIPHHCVVTLGYILTFTFRYLSSFTGIVIFNLKLQTSEFLQRCSYKFKFNF